MTDIPTVTLEVNAFGRGTIDVDGLDLSKYVQHLEVTVASGAATEVTLRLRPMNLSLIANPGVLKLVREKLIEQGDCTCTEILPELGTHMGGLDIDPACPQHGEKAHLS